MKNKFFVMLLVLIISIGIVFFMYSVEAADLENINIVEHNDDPGYNKFNKAQESKDETNNMLELKKVVAKASNSSSYPEAYAKQKKYKIIDISEFNGTINWKKVYDSGIKGVVIRLGVRGYGTDGQIWTDNRFKDNIKNAKKAGMKVGVYFYSNAISIEEARYEANYTLAVLAETNIKLDMPIFMDYEGSGGAAIGRFESANISPAFGTSICRTFCDIIKQYGYEVGIYANKYFIEAHAYPNELAKDYYMWYANYNDNGLYSINYPIDMWQFTSVGRVNGISGDVDVNYMFIKKPDKVKNLTYNIALSNPPTANVYWSSASGAKFYEITRLSYGVNNKDKQIENINSTTKKYELKQKFNEFKVRAANKKFGYIEYSDYATTGEFEADAKCQLTLEPLSNSVEPGGEIELALKVKNITNKKGIKMVGGTKPLYDSSVFEELIAEDSDNWKIFKEQWSDPRINIFDVAPKDGKPRTKDEEVLRFKLKVKPTAQEGSNYTITIKNLDISYQDGKGLIQIPNISAKVKIKEKIKGDINDDKKISLVDVLQIRRYIVMQKTGNHKNDWDLTEQQKKVADINGDGKVNLVDVLKIRRYIAANEKINIKNKHPEWISL